METTIDYASDYGGEASDYQTTMEGKQETENNYRFCPLKLHALLSTPEAVLGTSDSEAGWSAEKIYAPGRTQTRAVALFSPWPATNNNTPACSLMEWAGVALCLVWRCAGRYGPFWRVEI